MSHREMACGESPSETVFVFVASEPKGRKRTALVEPFRDCCVKAYGLIDPESGSQGCNLSGTAGVY